MADCEHILSFLQPGWIGVEIGVSRGQSAFRFLEWGVCFLYLVDPWTDYPGYLEETRGREWETIYKECTDRLSPFAGRYGLLRMPSADAARYIPAQVDFVWIDGNHRYEWVRSDLDLYWPKIKNGGVMCGHDFTDNEDTCQVARAVREFVRERGLALGTPPPCWVIPK